jgi:hypothetical protein
MISERRKLSKNKGKPMRERVKSRIDREGRGKVPKTSISLRHLWING